MKRVFTSIALFLTVNLAFSQITVQDLEKPVRASAVFPIESNGQIKGYMFSYFLDKVDKKNILFKVQIFDENMSPVKSKELILPRGFMLLDLEYNGEVFLMEFWNSEKRSMKYQLELRTYDSDLKLLASRPFELSGKEAPNYFTKTTNAQEGKESEKGIFSNGSKGFIRYSSEAMGSKVEAIVECVDNKLKTVWKWNTDPNNKLREDPMIGNGNENYHLTYIVQKKNLIAQKYKLMALMFDAKTGKVQYNIPLLDGKYMLNTAVAKVDDNGEVFMSGEYYEGDEFTPKSQSLGLYACTVTKEGKFANMKYSAWNKEIQKLLPAEVKAKFDDKVHVFIHDVIKMKDGKSYVLAEQYKSVASALGVASMMMGGGRGSASLVKIQLQDFMIFTIDGTNTIENISVFPKLKRGVELPSGYEMVPSSTIARFLAYTSQFDYSATQKDPNGEGFNIISQIKAENEEGKKEIVIGTISLNSEKKFTTDNIPFKEKGSNAFIYSAKHGYVLMGRYYKKEKKYTLGLEKINQ